MQLYNGQQLSGLEILNGMEVCVCVCVHEYDFNQWTSSKWAVCSIMWSVSPDAQLPAAVLSWPAANLRASEVHCLHQNPKSLQLNK